MKIYSRVLISLDEVFFKHSEENIHSADTSYERQADIHWDETIFLKPNNKKTKKNPALPISNFPFLNNF